MVMKRIMMMRMVTMKVMKTMKWTVMIRMVMKMKSTVMKRAAMKSGDEDDGKEDSDDDPLMINQPIYHISSVHTARVNAMFTSQ